MTATKRKRRPATTTTVVAVAEPQPVETIGRRVVEAIRERIDDQRRTVYELTLIDQTGYEERIGFAGNYQAAVSILFMAGGGHCPDQRVHQGELAMLVNPTTLPACPRPYQP